MNEQKTRLVVAEDDYLVAEEIKRILRGSRYDIVGEAGTGAEALAMVLQLQPDAVLMDIRMPQMDGLEASRRITAEYPTPIVIMTAYETADMVAEASSAGVAAFLTKPPVVEEIDRAVRIACARHADMMALRRLNSQLRQAMEEIKTLQGILPICMYCKKIRDDKGYWQQVDQYITEHTQAVFSHCLCQDCYEKHYSDLALKQSTRKSSSGPLSS